MRITIDYKVPISVIVDMEQHRVHRVLIHDEEVDMEPSDVFTEDGETIIGSPLASEAQKIADVADAWPAWEFA